MILFYVKHIFINSRKCRHCIRNDETITTEPIHHFVTVGSVHVCNNGLVVIR